MRNPYEILGISPNASDDEIKKAYRNLSRKYHPDANINNPNKEEAEERFKEVQQAYDAIMNRNTSGFGGGFNSYGYSHSGTYNGGNSGSSQDSYYVVAANFIRNRRFAEAVRVLDEIKLHDGKWYYLSCLAMAGLGNTATAMDYIRKAMEMEPDNVEYRQVYMQLSSVGEWYTGRGRYYGMPMNNVSGMCCEICLFNMCCNPCFSPCC